MPRAQAYQPWLWFCCRWTQSLSGTPSEAEIHDIDMNLSKARTVAFISLVFCDLWPQRDQPGLRSWSDSETWVEEPPVMWATQPSKNLPLGWFIPFIPRIYGDFGDGLLLGLLH